MLRERVIDWKMTECQSKGKSPPWMGEAEGSGGCREVEGVPGRAEARAESHRFAASTVLLRRAELFSWGGYKTGE